MRLNRSSQKLSASTFLAVNAQTSGGTYRTESYNGIDYLVVPVVALVEGVLQGVTANQPELALAAEFGRFASSWNGRPVTMDHPFIQNNAAEAGDEIIRVSASATPAILSAFQLGFIFNARLEDSVKLVCEAWLDANKMALHSDQSRVLLGKIQKGEKIEVSTGLFTGTEENQGEFNGKEYFSIWRNIVPDHLALLPEGTIGACSIADGCGVFANAATGLKANLLGSCKCGGACTNCPSIKPMEKTKLDVGTFLANIVFNTSHNMMNDDVHKVLQAQLDAEGTNDYAYLIGFTPDKAVYSKYDAKGNRSTYQRSYQIDDAGKSATFSDDEEKVNITSQITPVDQASSGSTTSGSFGTLQAKDQPQPQLQPNATTTTQEIPMVDLKTQEEIDANTKATVDAKKAADKKAADKKETAGAASPTGCAAAPVVVNASPVSVEAYLAAAPAEIRESLVAGLRMHSNHKASLIATLKANARNNFTDAQLGAFDVTTLENLVSLAKVPDYSGMMAAGSGISAQQAQQVDESQQAWAAAPPRLGSVNAGNRSIVKDANGNIVRSA
jgi:hypothetical protein